MSPDGAKQPSESGPPKLDCTVLSDPDCAMRNCGISSNPNCLASTFARNVLQIGDNPYPGIRVISTPGSNYVDPSVIELLRNLGDSYHRRHPAGELIVVGDMSPPIGRTHGTHNGFSSDILPMTTDGNIRPPDASGTRGPLTFNSANYDSAATIEVIRDLINTGRVRLILFNDPVVQGQFPGIVKPCCKIPGTVPLVYDHKHDDHFHVDFWGG